MEGGGKSEISDLEGHVCREEHVPQLEVPVEDVPGVDVSDPLADLDHVVADFGLGQDFPGLHHVEEGPLGAVLEDDVDVGAGVVEPFVELERYHEI